MKKKILTGLLVLTGMFTLACSSGCVLIADSILTHIQMPLKESQEAEMTVNYNAETGKYDVRVEGVVLNDWQKEVLQGTVSISFYDEHGNVLATGSATVGKIAAGQSWRYCVTTALDIEPVEFEITELFAYGWEKITNK